MQRRLKLTIAVAVVAGLAVVGTTALAGGGKDIREHLTGYQEDPLALSTTGHGTFDARVDKSAQKIFYRLRYADLEGNVTQAHIHLGGRSQSGGIIVFLCSNVGGGPVGTQACPTAPGEVTGTLQPADVIGPAAQGIDPGQFDELVRAIRANTTYVNVHSTKYPGGEIRAQIDRNGHNGDGHRKKR